MEVDFTVEEEQRLSEVGAKAGKPVATLVRHAVLAALDADARFEAALRKGIESADAGHLLEHSEVVARLEHRYRS